MNPITRRDFMKQAGLASAALPAVAGAQDRGAVVRREAAVQTKETLNPVPVRVGMTDWNLGQRGDITKVALAREIGLDGIQVSVQYPTDGKPTVRDDKTQEAFKRAALDNGIQICSLAIGNPGKARCRCTRIRRSPFCSSRRCRLRTIWARTTSCCRFSATATSTWPTRRRSTRSSR